MKWKLLAKYLSKETSEKENQKIQKWINKNSKNDRLLKNTKILWESMEKQKEHIDVDKAWSQLKAKIDTTRENESTPVLSIKQTVLKYAASVILIIGIGTIGYFSYQQFGKSGNMVSIETSLNESNKEIKLPDGSVAFLNKESEVNYPKTFKEEARSIHFTGEAYFDIEKDKDKPFVINTDKATIEVLGTSFNVNTRSSNKVEVFVKSGKVKLRSKSENNSIIITKGFIGILEGTKLTKKRNEDVNYLAWRTGKLIFKKSKLEEVVQSINRTYDTRIIINSDSIKNKEITATFDQEPVEHILEVIGRTFGVEIQKENQTYFIGEENN